MMGLIERNYMLQFPFHDAEQHFLDWYFKFTRSASVRTLDRPVHQVSIHADCGPCSTTSAPKHA